MRVLFLTSFSSCSTAVVRALTKAGHEVDLAFEAESRRQRASRHFLSRDVRRCFIVPRPHENPRALVDALSALLTREGPYDVLLALDYPQHLTLTRASDELSAHTAVATAPERVLQQLHDKALQADIAQSLGIATPHEYRYADLDDLRAQVETYPILLKARRGSGAHGLRFARNPEELEMAFRALRAMPAPFPELDQFAPPIVQEVVPGPVHDVGYLFCRGKMRMAVSQRRELMYPRRAGIAVQLVMTHEPDLIEQGRKLLEHVGWHGACQVEFKRDARDGTIRFLEVNPRFWGSIDAAVRAGADFPTKLCELTAYGDTPEQYDYKVGMRYTIVLPLMLRSLVESRGERRNRLRGLRQVLSGTSCCEIERRDIRPHLWMLAGALSRIARHPRAAFAPAPRATP